jgi:LEA14-like dessication related protein
MAYFSSCSVPKEIVYNQYKNLEIERLGFENSTVRLDLEYYNPNNFGLQLRRTELEITVNGSYLGKSVSDTLINIPRRDTFTLPIKFDVDMKNLFKNAFSTLSGNEITVKVFGKLKIGKSNVFMNMPINYEGKHKFSVF